MRSGRKFLKRIVFKKPECSDVFRLFLSELGFLGFDDFRMLSLVLCRFFDFMVFCFRDVLCCTPF